MLVAIPAETEPHERRVAAVPGSVARLRAAGFEVAVQPGAGASSHFADADYAERGARLEGDLGALLGQADVVCKVSPPSAAEIALMRPGSSYVGFLPPTDTSTIDALAAAGVTAYSLDLVPRTSQAQPMDAVTSQAGVAGYRAALVAAEVLPRFFPMLVTAAGTVPPAKVLVLGTGVAGLQAIATARRLGAVVSAYDVRPASGQEVRSLGATFLELEQPVWEGAGGLARATDEVFLARQRELIGVHVGRADVVIATAAVPGRPAPTLVTSTMLRWMTPGSVVVDLACEWGGNCEGSRPGETVRVGGVTVWGGRNVPSQLPTHASTLYAGNVAAFVELLGSTGADPWAAEILAATRMTDGGAVLAPAGGDSPPSGGVGESKGVDG